MSDKTILTVTGTGLTVFLLGTVATVTALAYEPPPTVLTFTGPAGIETTIGQFRDVGSPGRVLSCAPVTAVNTSPETLELHAQQDWELHRGEDIRTPHHPDMVRILSDGPVKSGEEVVGDVCFFLGHQRS